jgi:hypothetical protein
MAAGNSTFSLRISPGMTDPRSFGLLIEFQSFMGCWDGRYQFQLQVNS